MFKWLKKKTHRITEDDIYYEDENDNRWSKSRFTLVKATVASKSLVNCYNCIDCIDCHNCYGCIDCNGCKGCTGCRCCRGCATCRYCVGCVGCLECCDCFNCRNCSGRDEYKNNKPKRNPILFRDYNGLRKELSTPAIEPYHNCGDCPSDFWCEYNDSKEQWEVVNSNNGSYKYPLSGFSYCPWCGERPGWPEEE